MRNPDPEEIESEFQVLDEEYDRPGFYGGAFEGSHAFADVVLFRLYSVVPGDGETDTLRIETRHHAGGRVLEHIRAERALSPDRTLTETGESLESFCRSHHYDDPHGEMTELLESIQHSHG